LPNETGRKPDITKKEYLEWSYSIWTINPNTPVEANHPCAFPESLVERLIKLYSFPQDIILDNFNGSGTTTCVASRLNRKFVGIDQNGS
jgi:site-specific DNA-methyltransferase (adenine-specific)